MSTFISNNHESKSLVAGSTSTIQVPLYGRIQSLILLFKKSDGTQPSQADIIADIENIRLSVNGSDIVNCKPYQLFNLYKFLGSKIGNGDLNGAVELNIGKLVFTDPAVRKMFGFGSNDINSMQVHVTAKATISNDTGTVQAVTQRDKVAQNMNAYMKFQNYTQSFTGTGEHTVDTLPKDLNSAYFFAMIGGNTSRLSHSEVRVNAETVREKLDADANNIFCSNAGYNPVDNIYTVSFTDGSIDNQYGMTGITDLRFLNTFTTAPTASYDMAILRGINSLRPMLQEFAKS